MSTRSFARNLFPPLDNPELTIRRRSRANPTLLNDFEMAAEGNGDLPVPDLWTMEELCQPSLNGRGGPIAPIAIQAMNFGLKNDMIQQVQNSCQFHGLLGDDANKHLDKFLHVTQSIKVNGVTDDALHLYLFPHSLTHHATACLTLRHRDTINAAAGGTFMKRRPEECYDLIENRTAHHNDCPAIVCQTQNIYVAGAYQGNSYQPQGNRNLLSYRSDNYLGLPGERPRKEPILPGSFTWSKPTSSLSSFGLPSSSSSTQIPQPQVVTTNEFTNFMKANDAILKNMRTNMTSLTNSNLELKNMFGQFIKMNTTSSSGLGTLPGNTITNLKEELKGITTRSRTAYQGPTIPTYSSSLPLVVERETEETKDTVQPTNNRSTEDVQPPVDQTESPILNSEPVAAPVSASKPNQRPLISYPSRLHDQKLRDKANDQREKLFQIFKDSNFNISFADFAADPRVALILGRSFLKTERALIDVFAGELTLRVGKEAITFNLDQTSRYSANYNDMTANRIDVIVMAYEEYSQEVLHFSDVIASGNPTSYYDPIVFTTSPNLTPFETSDFFLEAVDAFLSLEDDPTSSEVD
uniref:Reverse transcriptase domain-containing protein n=1 Tax=Tanacetum cinerariifolium TaxID=118510 RepID=A0A6L2NM76_TANCI|nr:reverse transcriptase domain-containing protein [Tanacetum cinerariifolium]